VAAGGLASRTASVVEQLGALARGWQFLDANNLEEEAVRKLLVAFGIVALAGPALAHHKSGEENQINRESFKSLKHNPRTIRVRLERTMGDQLGPNVDVAALCGPAGAQRVDVRRNVGDVLTAFVTIGFYTPAHGYVLCNGI
jgi:hypothetical protein